MRIGHNIYPSTLPDGGPLRVHGTGTPIFHQNNVQRECRAEKQCQTFPHIRVPCRCCSSKRYPHTTTTKLHNSAQSYRQYFEIQIFMCFFSCRVSLLYPVCCLRARSSGIAVHRIGSSSREGRFPGHRRGTPIFWPPLPRMDVIC